MLFVDYIKFDLQSFERYIFFILLLFSFYLQSFDCYIYIIIIFSIAFLKI
jgi:hypothetical protein